MSLGGILTSDIDADLVGNDTRILVRGTDNAVYEMRQSPTGSITGFRRIGGWLTSNPVGIGATSPSTDPFYADIVVARGSDSAEYVSVQNQPMAPAFVPGPYSAFGRFAGPLHS